MSPTTPEPHRDSIIEAGLAAPAPEVSDPITSAKDVTASNSASSAHANTAPAKAVGGVSVERLVQSKLAVLAILFGVTGFLGLPLLWMNRRFSDGERVFWAIANIIYTSGLIYLAFRICLWSYRQIFPG